MYKPVEVEIPSWETASRSTCDRLSSPEFLGNLVKSESVWNRTRWMGMALNLVSTLPFLGHVPTLPSPHWFPAGAVRWPALLPEMHGTLLCSTRRQPWGAWGLPPRRSSHWPHCWSEMPARQGANCVCTLLLWFRAVYPCTVLFKGWKVYNAEEGIAKYDHCCIAAVSWLTTKFFWVWEEDKSNPTDLLT